MNCYTVLTHKRASHTIQIKCWLQSSQTILRRVLFNSLIKFVSGKTPMSQVTEKHSLFLRQNLWDGCWELEFWAIFSGNSENHCDSSNSLICFIVPMKRTQYSWADWHFPRGSLPFSKIYLFLFSMLMSFFKEIKSQVALFYLNP